MLNVPDTVGYTLPEEFGAADRPACAEDVPGVVLSVHCHNDLGLAVANSLAAVQAGARQVEGTINGIGERAGNTLPRGARDGAPRPAGALRRAAPACAREEITRTSQLLSSITGVWPQPNKAVVGRNAFAHEAGIHQHGVLNNPLTLRDHDPGQRGRRREPARARQTLRPPRGGVAPARAGRRALAARRSEDLTARVKELADRKKFVYDEDLLDPGAPRRRSAARGCCATRSSPATSSCPRPPSRSRWTAQRRSASAVGNGPLDAALKATDAALGLDVELLELHTRAVTAGKDAMAEVVVRVRRRGRGDHGAGRQHRTPSRRRSRRTCRRWGRS